MPPTSPDMSQAVSRGIMRPEVDRAGSEPASAPVTDELAGSMSQKAKEGKWQSGFELGKKTEVGDYKSKIGEIGVKRDATTGAKMRSIEEQRRYDRAYRAGELIKKYLDGGFDSLGHGEQGQLIREVLEEAKSRPAVAAELFATTVSNSEREAFAKRILRP